MQSVLFQKQDVMAEHMLIVILLCPSQLGFLLNFNYTLLNISSSISIYYEGIQEIKDG